MEEPSLGPAVRLAARLLRHWLEAGELGVLKRVRVCRRGVGCLREGGGSLEKWGEVRQEWGSVRESWVAERSGVQSGRNGLQSVMEEWGAVS